MIEIWEIIYKESPILFYSIILIYIWIIICLWKIFLKAWRKWWESLIPIRHIYVLFKISHKVNPWFWILLILPFIFWLLCILLIIFIFTINKEQSNLIIIWLNIISIIATAIYAILLYWLTKVFWKSKRFFFWLFFFVPIFFWILAFDDSKYLNNINVS